MDKSDFYLQDIDLLRQLAPIMVKKGIEADKKIKTGELRIIGHFNGGTPAYDSIKIGTYRKDSLEAALPEWCFYGYDRASSTCELGDKWHEAMHEIELKCGEEMYWKIENLLFDVFTNRDNLKALAELIILLDKEGVE